MRWMITLSFLLPSLCWGQSAYTIPLEKLNPSLAIPSMAAHGGVLYVAYRSFDWLRFSSELQVEAYDIGSRKEVQHATIAVPKVHGARAADGFFLSPDSQTLVYAEIYEPTLLLVLSAKDLSEARRTRSVPFAQKDRQRVFAGFDDDGLLSFLSKKWGELRFIRVDPVTFKVASEISTEWPDQYTSTAVAWSPSGKTIWMHERKNSLTLKQYTEQGRATGKELYHKNGIDNGAIPRLRDGLVAFYSRSMADDGSIVSYDNEHSGELRLECVPSPYGASNGPEYFGAICTTAPENVPPGHRGYKTLSSEFLLLKTPGPSIIWRHAMDFLSVADSNDPDTGRQGGDPLVYRAGSKLLIVAPSKSPNLTVYEVALPNDGQVTSVSK